jgi:chromosome segregation ATPase
MPRLEQRLRARADTPAVTARRNPMAKNLVLMVLKEIRDELRNTREELSRRIDATNARLDAANSRLDATNGSLGDVVQRLGHLEGGMLDLAEQQRFVVGYVRAISARDHRFAADLAELRSRVEALETRDPR